MIAWIGNVVSWRSTSTRQHSPALATRSMPWQVQLQSAEVIGAMQRVVKGEDVLASVTWHRSTCVEMSYDRKYHEEYEVS